MRWSLYVVKLFGIEFRVHVTFLLLLLFVFLAGSAEGGIDTGLNGVLFLSAVFACVLVHEVGHSLIARRFGSVVKSITLLPIGGVATMEEIPAKPVHEIAMAAIGPLINLAIAGLLYVAAGGNVVLAYPTLYPETSAAFLSGLVSVNVILAVFNMVPAFPMDGGRVLRGLLALKLDFVKATSIAVTIGQGLAMMMIFFGILGNLWLAIIGFFLYVGAGGENRAVMMRSVLGRVPTSEAMVTDFRSLRPEMPLADAIAGIQRGCQEDFPVIGDDGLEGVLTQAAIVAAIREKGQTAMVSDAMERDVLIVAGTETLDKVFRRIVVERKPAAAVVEGGRLKGMLCPDGLNRFLGIRLALKGLSAD